MIKMDWNSIVAASRWDWTRCGDSVRWNGNEEVSGPSEVVLVPACLETERRVSGACTRWAPSLRLIVVKHDGKTRVWRFVDRWIEVSWIAAMGITTRTTMFDSFLSLDIIAHIHSALAITVFTPLFFLLSCKLFEKWRMLGRDRFRVES